MLSVFTWLIDHLIRRQIDVRVRVHRAMLLPRHFDSASASVVTQTVKVEGIDAEILERLVRAAKEGTHGEGIDAYFVNVWNASVVRSIGLTHVWVATEPEVPVLTRQPPGQLDPDSQWETWVETDQLPAGASGVEHLVRVKLTNGDVIESVPREDAPTAGHVPG